MNNDSAQANTLAGFTILPEQKKDRGLAGSGPENL